MVKPANDNYSLEDMVFDGMIVNSDLHGRSDILENGLKYAGDNNLLYAFNGDFVNDYAFSELVDKLGYKSPMRMQMEYLSENLGDGDLETLALMQNISQYGIEGILSSIPESQRDKVKKDLEKKLEYGSSEFFQKKLEKTFNKFVDEKGTELQEHSLKLRALYDVFMDEEAKSFADSLNKYSGVKVAFNKGNHENVYFVEMVRQYLDNPNQIIDLGTQEGYYTLKTNNGDINIAGISNTTMQIMPYVNEIFSPEEVNMLYSHIALDENRYKSLMVGNGSKDELDKLKDYYIREYDFNRIKKGADGKSLDVLLSHGQIGTPYMNGRKGQDRPYLASAAALSLEAKLTVEGHIHGKYDGQNSLGKDMVRAAGEEGAIIRKDKNGNIIKDWVKLGSEYNGGHHTPIPYDLDYLEMRVEDMLKQYEMFMNNNETTNSNNNLSDSKAA